MVKVVQDQNVLFGVGEEQVQGVEEILQKGGLHPLRGPGQPPVGPLGEGEPSQELADETALVVVVGIQRDPGVLVALRGQPLRDGEALSEPAGSPDVDPVPSALLRGVQNRVHPRTGQNSLSCAGRKEVFLGHGLFSLDVLRDGFKRIFDSHTIIQERDEG